MENVMTNNHKAGFWVRFTAILIDLIIIWVAVKLVVEVFIRAGAYVPFEFTFVLSLLIYSALSIGWRGCTIGKALCGLVVQSSKGGPAGYFRALFRETICKLLSAVVLFLGFIWIAFSRKKRGWHDYIAATIVVQKTEARRRARFFLWTMLALFAILVAVHVPQMGRLFLDVRRMALSPDTKMPYDDRAPSSLVEISSLSKRDHAKFIEWLDLNAKDPVDYVVETTAKHQITIFGEMHEQKDYLLFLNQIIPELYHRAGVTCVAMEVCMAEDNEKIERLVTAPEFDRDLALEIARHQSWGIWGFKEYWDVFETVWRLNKSLPEDKKKMRLVGIDAKFDGPSLGLVTGGEGAKIKAPIWEKLRIFRLTDDIVLLLKRDEIMAGNVEKELINKGERGIVWIGLNHSYINYQQPIIIKGKLVRKFSRMGMMLHHKYGDQIFQVTLHEVYFDSVMKKFIEPVMKERGNTPAGFDVSDSPFENLRDKDAEDYRFYPNLKFADKAFGYIYLKPANKLGKCQWLPGYISREMFVRNKPYYKAWAGFAEKEINNEQQANEALKMIMEN